MLKGLQVLEIIGLLENASYLGLFVMALFGGYFIPAPEAVLLMLAGYVAGIGFVEISSVLPLCVLGGILGDALLFWLSLRGSKYIGYLKRHIRKSKLSKYEHYMHDHIGKAVFFLRFIVGVRFFAPVLAGTLGVNWKRFLFFDILASTLNAVFFVLLGYTLRKDILVAITSVEVVKNILFALSAVIISVAIGFFVKKEYLKNL